VRDLSLFAIRKTRRDTKKPHFLKAAQTLMKKRVLFVSYNNE